MKKYILVILLFKAGFLASQSVSLNVFGRDSTEEQAVLDALRNALTQSSSVYITSNMTIINDELVKDEMSMINNGSIESYKVLSKIKAGNQFVVNLDVVVSVLKLTSFVESKGGTSELKGGLFATNIKLQELNEKAELAAVKSILEVSNSILSNSFDYNIKNGEPTKSGDKWAVPLSINVKRNSNYNAFINFFYGSLQNLSMNNEEVRSYIKLQKPIFTIGLFDSRGHKFSLQKVRLNSQFLSTVPRQDGIKYFCKKYDQDTLKLVASSLKNALKFEKKWTEANNTYWGPARTGDYACQGKLFLCHDSSLVKHLVFRNKETHELIKLFVENLEKEIRDVLISNSIDSTILNSLLISNEGYYNRNNLGRGNSFQLQEQAANFIITFGNYMNSENFEFIGKELTLTAGEEDYQFYPRIGRTLIRNFNWEKKMLVGYKYDEKGKLITYEQCLELLEKEERTRIRTGYFDGAEINKLYLDYLFSDYYDYLNQLLVFRYHSGYDNTKYGDKVLSYPLQLSLIGNEDNIVFEFKVVNYLTTQEISRVSSYKIIKSGNN